MNLLSFVRSLPNQWATAPIYKKGVPLPKGGEACGKNPLGRAHHDKMSPEATAMVIEREPEKFQAVGVFTGHVLKGWSSLTLMPTSALLRPSGAKT